MQLIRAALIAGLSLMLASAAMAQSLSPTHGVGPTPSDIKGFKLRVGNPYKTAMTFVVTPMDPAFNGPVEGAEVQPSLLTLAPGFSRQVIVAFKIGPGSKERTIGVCVMPQKIMGPVLPRVCGRYTGELLSRPGG